VVRALLRQHGYRLRSGATESFLSRVAELELSADLQAAIEPLVRAMQSVNAQLAALEPQTETMAQDDEVVQRLSTAPGVGPLTALSFVATLDEVERFDNVHHVESYLGLVPRGWSSGEQQQRGKITKQGSGQMRALLVGAAWRILRRQGVVGSKLRHWAERLAARRGKRVAVVALARRLAGILYALWRDGSSYDEARVGQHLRRAAVTV
jgi:transposase